MKGVDGPSCGSAEVNGLLSDEDLYAERADGASTISVLFNVCISFIGAGILSLPFAFSRIGLGLGCITFAVVALLCIYCMLILIETKYVIERRNPASDRLDSFGAVGHACFGPVGRWIVDVPVALSQVGFCIGYILFITVNCKFLFGFAPHSVCTAAVPLLAYLVLQRHMKALAPFSLFADVANISAIVIVIATDWLQLGHTSCAEFIDPKQQPCRPDADEIEFLGVTSMLPYFVGVAAYCFEGTALVLPLEASSRSPKQFPRNLTLTLLVITAVEIVFGALGYLAYGSSTAQVITLNMPNGMFSLIVRVCLCGGLYFTFPIMMFPVVKLGDEMLAHQLKPDSAPFRHCSNVMRVTLVLLALGIALLVPDFSLFMSLIGAFCCQWLAFILPAVFHLHACYRTGSISTWRALLDVFIVVFGVLFAVFGTADAIARLNAGGFQGHV